MDIAVLDATNSVFPTDNVEPFPAIVPGHKDRQLLITFVPTSCVDGPDESWGTVSMDLDVAGFWSLGRTHEIPVMETNSLSVFEPAQVTDVPQTPLAAACALLGR